MKLGLDFGYLARHGFWVAGGQVVATAASLAGSVAMARLTAPSVLGQYQYVTSLLGFFSVAALTGMNLPVMKAVVEGRPHALAKAYRVSWWSSLLAVPCLAGVALYLWVTGQSSVAAAVLAGMLIFPWLYAPRAWPAYLEAHKQFRGVAVRVIWAQWLMVLALIAALWLGAGVFWLIVIWALVPAVMHNYYYRQIKRQLPASGDMSFNVKLGLTMTAQKFSQSLTSTLPAIVIAWYFVYDQVALWSIAFYLLTFAVSLSFAAMSVFLPIFFEVKQKREQWWRVTLANFGVGIGLALVFASGVRFLFGWLYGPAYDTSLRIIWWLMPAVVFFPFKAYLGHFLTASGHNISQIVVNLAGHAAGVIWLAGWHGQMDFVPLLSAYYLIIVLGPMLPLGWLGLKEWNQSDFKKDEMIGETGEAD